MDKRYRDLIAYNVSQHIPLDFHIEALKCQAIIERTIIFRNIKDGSFKIENLDNNYSYIDKKIYDAVDDTKNLVIMVNNNPIMAFYHVACGGSTENSENILDNKIDYLRRVTCEDCLKNKEFNNIIDISVEDLESKFNSISSNNLLDDFSIKDILKILKRNESQRVDIISVFNKEIKGCEFSKSLNLNSSRFGFKPKEIRFYTKGIGHGLGLCQYGANEKANSNWKFEDILNYYYTNINICSIEGFNSKYPLKGKNFFIDPGHGGKDEGYISEDGIKEKDITLKICLNIEEMLKNYGANVNITRTEDEYIRLDERIKLIRNYNPDFLISIHLNNSKFQDVNGIEGFYYWGDDEGKSLGEKIVNSVNELLNVKNRGVREGKVYILKESGSNGVYLEIGYLSNVKEKNNFKDDNYIKEMANVIVEGILKYYSNKALT